MSNNPVSFTDPDGGWDGDSGINDGFAQAVESTENWTRMTPSERRQYQAVNGTDYAGQFRDQVLDLAFIGGYEDKDGNLWHYSSRKSDIGAWMKMYDNSPFGYYRTASGDGAFKVGASWLDVSERWVGAGYNAWLERYKWAQRTYGGTGDGSILDQLHQSFSNFNTKYNPVAHLVNGINGVAFGTDRFGNQQSGMQTTTQLASGIVGIFGTGIAKGIAGAAVGEGMPAIVNEGGGLVDDLVRVRHHTSTKGLKGIKNIGSINASRGKPYGVDVEVAPFLKPSQVNMGQVGGGIKGGGGYIEFSIPRSQVGPISGYMGGIGNPGRIITGGTPLNLNGTNPNFVRNWWPW